MNVRGRSLARLTNGAAMPPSAVIAATEADPAKPGPFSIPNFSPVEGISFDRLEERRKLLGNFDQIRRDVDASGIMGAMDSFQQKAWDIVSGPEARAAFDLDKQALPRWDRRDRFIERRDRFAFARVEFPQLGERLVGESSPLRARRAPACGRERLDQQRHAHRGEPGPALRRRPQKRHGALQG